MQRILLLFLLLFVSNGVPAQIADEVKEIMKKCEQKMNPPEGCEMDMDVKFLVIKMHVKSITKGQKSFMSTSAKMLGQEIKVDVGFDGSQEWEYDSQTDSLIITKTTQRSDQDEDLDFNLDTKYKTAKMKVTDGHYEITFTNPIKKDVPGKAVMKISKGTYCLAEMQMGSGLKSITMKITKIKFGNIDDSVFVLDPKKYPTAKILRK